ncbi:reverse transcriptase [Phytophthora megakarya]|uniref:Reverse transcriptase n=1 Tax=Phytophthora megakarya TaxID=4795 RepID=A0A225UN68_9STRA|nr:reverse transcriptase [Phytophthora megakarya]
MQSFLGSLNYYSQLIEDYAIYASVLYELREVECAELEKRSDRKEILDRNDPIPRDHDPTELKSTRSVDERWIRAHRAFTTLKTKIATTPVLRHFDETRTPELWVISFDGSARVKRGGGAFSAIVWSLPGWEVVKGQIRLSREPHCERSRI